MSLIRAVVTGEKGNEFDNGIVLPSGIFPNINDQRFALLRFVDPYGNTIFNRLQIPTLLADLLRLSESTMMGHKEQELMKHVELLCKQC